MSIFPPQQYTSSPIAWDPKAEKFLKINGIIKIPAAAIGPLLTVLLVVDIW